MPVGATSLLPLSLSLPQSQTGSMATWHRRLNQYTTFGAFLDPVADKLIVATALVLLATDENVLNLVYSVPLFAASVAIIIGREIVISALREWMAELGKTSKCRCLIYW